MLYLCLIPYLFSNDFIINFKQTTNQTREQSLEEDDTGGLAQMLPLKHTKTLTITPGSGSKDLPDCTEKYKGSRDPVLRIAVAAKETLSY